MKLFPFQIVIVYREGNQPVVFRAYSGSRKGEIRMQVHWKWTPLFSAMVMGLTFALAFFQMG